MKSKTTKPKKRRATVLASNFDKSENQKNRMIDYLDDCNPAIRHLAYINLMIA